MAEENLQCQFEGCKMIAPVGLNREWWCLEHFNFGAELSEPTSEWPYFIDKDDGFIWEESQGEPGSGAEHLTKEDVVRRLNIMFSTIDEHRDEIRVAIVNEREECAVIDGFLIGCPLCHSESGEPCRNDRGAPITQLHHQRWRAAIRARR